MLSFENFMDKKNISKYYTLFKNFTNGYSDHTYFSKIPLVSDFLYQIWYGIAHFLFKNKNQINNSIHILDHIQKKYPSLIPLIKFNFEQFHRAEYVEEISFYVRTHEIDIPGTGEYEGRTICKTDYIQIIVDKSGNYYIETVSVFTKISGKFLYMTTNHYKKYLTIEDLCQTYMGFIQKADIDTSNYDENNQREISPDWTHVDYTPIIRTIDYLK